jgi:energy-coupling factor transport system ATP-binding protein
VTVRLKRSLMDTRAAPVEALRGVDARLRSAQVVGVTGASGAGKSTLVSVLAGLLRPTGGSVQAHPELAVGRRTEPWRWSSRDLAGRLSWVAQLPEQAVVTRSVREEVLCAATATGRGGAGAERRAALLLEALSLAHLADASPYHLSGGEQRRLMVAAALAHGPGGVLLDEPTVGQDRGTWSAVTGVIAAARDAGAGVALSTHDTLALEAVADHTMTLQRGLVVA